MGFFFFSAFYVLDFFAIVGGRMGAVCRLDGWKGGGILEWRGAFLS